VQVKDLLTRAADFYGWAYSKDHPGDRPAYPRHLRGVQLPLAPPLATNCCCFAEAIVVGAAQDLDPDFTWSRQQHDQMMILDPAHLFSPVEVLVAAGLAKTNPPGEVPPPWSVVQVWRVDRKQGHTFIVADSRTDIKRVLVLEANCAYGLNGVGWRRFGPLTAESPAVPPKAWYASARATSWPAVLAAYDTQSCQLLIG
jgi:hypothetical protein